MLYSFWNWLTRRSLLEFSPRGRHGRLHRRRRALPQLETLESRELLAAAVAVAHPDYVMLAHSSTKPNSGPGSDGYSPAQIEQAYGINQITFANGTVAGNGAGTTIAIVDAYNDPNIASDLQQFDAAFGLPNTTLTVVNETGGTTLPKASTSWAEETSLDVEWAHAIAPGAKILLVEANSSSYSDLMTGVQTAAKAPGVVVVSMSWGGSEFSGETSYDSYFTTPSGHAGVTFIASSGDSGAPVSYPSSSPNVLSVGGTTLSLSSADAILSESGWSDSGGGISTVESQPSYQKGIVSQSTTMRTNPDVAYDADPNTGFPEYNSYSFPTSPWQQFGGTSDAAPQWAGIIAIADQGRALAGLGSLDGPTQTLPMIYSAPSSDFHDITSGTSTGSPHYSAGTGYDLVTGRGTPVANSLVAYLVGTSSTPTNPTNPTATHFSVSVAPVAGTSYDIAGTAFTLTVTALQANSSVATGYTGTVQLTSTDPAAAQLGTVAFTSADKGVVNVSVTLKTAGSETITATDATTGITGSGAVTIDPGAASALEFVQQPASATVGAAINPAVTVAVVDAFGNVETGDSTGTVSLALNGTGGTLSGSSANVVNGIATFSSITVSAAGTYSLTATSGALKSATSASFTISAGYQGSGNLIEGFETPDNWFFTGNSYGETAYLTTAAAHDGTYGLALDGNSWIYRTDAAATVNAGDTLSAWVQFVGSANGRAYLGFGSSSTGTLSLVAAPNTGQLLLQSNGGYTNYVNLAAANQTYVANQWYRLEVDWGKSGTIVGKLFSSNGTTLLQSVTAKVTGITTGGIALRSIGNGNYWDTITDTPGVNNFTAPSQSNPTPATTSTSLEAALAEYLAEVRASEWAQAGTPAWSIW